MYILEAGQKFERYHIIRRLGQGGAGVSYEAADGKLKDKVVLKLIHPWSELSYAVRRQFFRDMQVLSVLAHTCLAAVLNYGEFAGKLYVVRRYTNKGSLLGNEGRVEFSPPLVIRDAFIYTYQLSQALHLIHSYDHVHGALTFSNILISERAEVDSAPLLLSDAGLAQFVRRFGQPQQSMLPMTAAPEQFKGQVTPASDQYALAILLSVWLTGRLPFAGPPAEIERLKSAGVIPALRSGLTGEQEGVIRRALNTKQEARYPSILAFAEALMASLQTPQLQTEKVEIINGQQQESEKPAESALKQIARAATEEQEQPPSPQVEPDIPQPQPAPQPIPEPQPEPAAPPAPPAPQPEVEPVIIPTPAPDIAQPIPEQTPFPPEPIQPQPTSEGDMPAEEIKSRYTEPLSYTTDIAVVPTAYLIITSPFPREPRKLPLLKDEVNLGRAGSSDILLDEDTITSRHHAQIKREGEQYVIYDKRSMYGVTVNGQKLEENVGQVLKEGDSIQIGDYSLLFSFQLIQDTDEARIEHALL